jgi:rhodanese-related sulfurtransferase
MQNDYLIDVREPDEVVLGSIPSSVNLPLSEIKTALAMPEDAFKAKYGFDKPQREQEIIFYCRSGKRSASAGDVAVRNGYTKWVVRSTLIRHADALSSVLNYQGSWLDWVSRHPQG